MEALGYGNQPYIIFKHNDIAREHIHIVSLRVDHRGRKINDKFEKRQSKKITDALERKFGLIPSSKVTDKAMKEMPKIDTTQRNIKEQVSNVVRMVLKHYHFCSLGELNAILSAYNLTVEEVKTEFRGKKYDGLVYVPTDDKSYKISTSINASDIGRGVGYCCCTEKDAEIQARNQATATNPQEQGVTSYAHLSSNRKRPAEQIGRTRLAGGNPKE